MKKKYSIKENRDVQKVLTEGRFFKCNSCIVYVMKNGTEKNNVAFLAGKKLGNSPIRNKAKRKLRAIMSSYWSKLYKGYDIVLIARPFLIDAQQDILIKDLECLLKKHRILSEVMCDNYNILESKKVGDVEDEETV